MGLFYRGSDWIGELPSIVQADIRARMVVRTLQDSERLYERNAEATGLYQVLSGFVQLKGTGASGNEFLITVYGPGHCLGEVPLLSNSDRAYDAIAQGETQVATLAKADFDELSLRYPEIPQILMNKLCLVIAGLLAHIEKSALAPLRERLASLILSASEAYGTEEKDGIVIAMPLSQEDMGKMLGVTRHSIQRELKYWKAEGIALKKKGRWVITDLNTLKSLAGNES